MKTNICCNIVYNSRTGGVLLMVLVLFGVLIVVLSATISYISRQYHETVNDEQRERVFHVTESGIDYMAYLLNSDSSLDHTGNVNGFAVTNPDGESAGLFDLSYSDLTDNGRDGVRVESVGWDMSRVRCQKITAEVERFGLVYSYVITYWNHEVSCP